MKLFANPIVLTGLVAFVALTVIGAGFGASIGNVPAEESKNLGGWKGTVQFQGGRGGTGTDYIASWARDGRSQDIIFSGVLDKVGGGGCASISGARYNLYVDDRLTWTSEVFGLSTSNVAIPAVNRAVIPGAVTSLPGAIGGDHVLKGTLDVLQDEGCFSTGKVWRHIATDGARLLDGAGSVTIRGGTDRFQEGDTVTIDVETGNGGPWKLEVYNGQGVITCSTKLEVAGYADDVADGRIPPPPGATEPGCKTPARYVWPGKADTTLKFKVPVGAFRSDGKNQWKAVLYNEVWKRGEDRFFTIDQANLAPETPLVIATPDPAKQGEIITLKIASRPNPKTLSPIKEFQVTVWYGSSPQIPSNGEDLIVNNQPVAATYANSRYEGTYTILPQRSANLQYRVVAIDHAGRPSGSVINAQQVKELENAGMPDPNANGRGSVDVEGAPTDVGLASPGSSTDTGLLLVLLAGLAVLVGAAYYLLPVPANIRLFAAAIIGVAGGVYVFGMVGA